MKKLKLLIYFLFRFQVSILVIMEVGEEGYIGVTYYTYRKVSILVIMEVGEEVDNSCNIIYEVKEFQSLL